VDHVISAYASAAASHGDSRVTLVSRQLREASSTASLDRPVPPGARLTVDVELEALADFPRCGVQFHLTRSDGLRIFDGVSFTESEAGVDVRQGSRIALNVTFAANVLRGMYTISVSLVDPQRRWEPVHLAGIASFVVHETTRWGGCSELFPRFDLKVESADHRYIPASRT
jgi:hypothetical protein